MMQMIVCAQIGFVNHLANYVYHILLEVGVEREMLKLSTSRVKPPNSN